MKKEIIGYRLVKPEYEKAASEIGNASKAEHARRIWEIHFSEYGYHVQHGCNAAKQLQSAGVLDLWFEPVYKEKEKEFEFGRWYKGTGERLYFITGKCTGYGFDYSGNWVNFVDDGIAFGFHRFTPATDAEVKERLLAYAREKYVVGIKFKTAADGSDLVSVVKGTPFMWENEYYSETEAIANCGTGLLYVRGKWAEIISEPEKDAEFREALRKVTDAFIKLQNLM